MNGELRLLIDSVLLMDGLSKSDRISLINRLESLSSKYFHSEISKIDIDIYGKLVNKEITLTLKEIGQAITEEKQVTFHYCDCELDGNPIFRVDKHGNVKQYIVNPYQIISKNEHSYLLCNLPQYDVQIDRIKDCKAVILL